MAAETERFGRDKGVGLASSLNDLAIAYYLLGRYAEAERLDERALTIRETALGRNHRDVARGARPCILLPALRRIATPLACRRGPPSADLCLRAAGRGRGRFERSNL